MRSCSLARPACAYPFLHTLERVKKLLFPRNVIPGRPPRVRAARGPRTCVDGPRDARVFGVSGSEVACGHVSGPRLREGRLCRRGAWPQALMGSVDRGLIRLAGSRCPMSSGRFCSTRRSTDDAITPFHPRNSPASDGAGRSGRCRHGAEVLLPRHHRPGDARHLVGERTGGDHALLLGQQFDQPGIVFGPPPSTAMAPLTRSRRR